MDVKDKNVENVQDENVQGTEAVTEEAVVEEASAEAVAEPQAKANGGKLEKAKVTLLGVIAVCLIVLVCQGFLAIESPEDDVQEVIVVGGEVDISNGVYVEGRVRVTNLDEISIRQESYSSPYMFNISPLDVRIVDANTIPIDIKKVNGSYIGYSVPVEVGR